MPGGSCWGDGQGWRKPRCRLVVLLRDGQVPWLWANTVRTLRPNLLPVREMSAPGIQRSFREAKCQWFPIWSSVPLFTTVTRVAPATAVLGSPTPAFTHPPDSTNPLSHTSQSPWLSAPELQPLDVASFFREAPSPGPHPGPSPQSLPLSELLRASPLPDCKSPDWEAQAQPHPDSTPQLFLL